MDNDPVKLVETNWELQIFGFHGGRLFMLALILGICTMWKWAVLSETSGTRHTSHCSYTREQDQRQQIWRLIQR
jgi:hypothetical protein